MANLPWLDAVETRLARQGLPHAYVQRFVRELSDHIEDLKEDNMSKEADVYSRLGEPEQVANTAVAAYRRHGFFGRHPTAAFVVFGVSPLVSLTALFVVAYLGVYGFCLVCKWLGLNISLTRLEPAASEILPYVLSLLTVIVPSIVASMLYCKLTKRLGIDRKWLLVACIVLAATALLPICSVKLSDVPGQSALRWGVAVPKRIGELPILIARTFSHPRQVLQFVVPLAIGWWFLRRSHGDKELHLAS